MLYMLLKILLGPLLLLILRPIVYGKQNLRVKGKAIFICNHRSMLAPGYNRHMHAQNGAFHGKEGNISNQR